jgi:hypothetical protein
MQNNSPKISRHFDGICSSSILGRRCEPSRVLVVGHYELQLRYTMPMRICGTPMLILIAHGIEWFCLSEQ